MDRHDKGRLADARDRYNVTDEIEVEFFVEGRVNRVRQVGQQQRIPVRRRIYDRLGCDICAGTWTVLDDKGLTKPFGKPLTHQACDDVIAAGGRESHDPVHWP